jgi:aspartate 1-decarboxylase
MQLNFLKAKIHRATVNGADLHYEGSISIDEALLQEANILPYEQVDVVNINNGERFTTYAIAAPKNSGIIQINGAAARKTCVGDLVIIISYCSLSDFEAKTWQPKVVLVDANNKIK